MSSVARGLAEVSPAPSVVTIGNFDGVHRGHRVLLDRAIARAHEAGVRSVAVTFDPHPVRLLRPEAAPPQLQHLEQRVAALVATGIDLVLVLPFTRELAALTPGAFVAEVLAGALAAVRVVVGSNFRFGARAAGDVDTLAELGPRHGFELEAVPLAAVEGRRISSSAIREHLAAGEVAAVTDALGRPHELTGEVVHGDGRGRTIGVPTANLAIASDLVVPPAGVYAGHARIGAPSPVPGGASWWPAVTNVGVRPTFDGTQRSVEVHLLDCEVDLYGRELTVTFAHWLRAERRFDGVPQLIAQIGADVERARELLAGA